MGGEGYFDSVLDSNTIMEITQYKYNLKTHPMHDIEGDLSEDSEDSMAAKHFEAMDNPLELLQFDSES